MMFLEKILRRKVTEETFHRVFKNHADTLMKNLLKERPNLSPLFRNEDLASIALTDFSAKFLDISRQTNSRKVQGWKLQGALFRSKMNEISFSYLSGECNDLALVAFSYNLVDQGDVLLGAIAEKTGLAGDNYEEFVLLAKAYFKKKFYGEVYKNGAFHTVIEILFSNSIGSGDVINPENLRRYELLIKEHVRKICAETMLWNTTDGDGLMGSAKQKYDFSEGKKRIDLIERFIQGVDLNSNKIMDQVCEEFPTVLQKNFDVFEEVKTQLNL